MTKLMILLLVMGVVIISEVESACQCSDLTLQDQKGQTTGKCLSKFRGKSWCYVPSNSDCLDKKASKRDEDIYWSADACDKRKGYNQCKIVACGKDSDCPPYCSGCNQQLQKCNLIEDEADPYCYYSNNTNTRNTRCDPGYYSSNWDGFCCSKGYMPMVEELFTSLKASELRCIRSSPTIPICPPHFESCFDDYCCPSICPETIRDTIMSFRADRHIMPCRTCDGYCGEGVRVVKKAICGAIPWYLFPLKAACKELLGAFSPAACRTFCKLIC